MALVVLTQEELQERIGGEDALALLASPSAELDADAETAIDKAITDVSSEIESALAGLGIDYATVPNELKDIGAVLVQEKLYEDIWKRVPADKAKAADRARKKLEAFVEGFASANGATPAKQAAASFSWQDMGNNPSSDNPRQTVSARMRRLP